MVTENISTENNRNTRLQKLSGSDFEIVDGEPDIRGWDVKDVSGKQIGEVEELIFDLQSRKVRYLVVDLEDNDFDLDSREVLVPIGVAELHESDDDVILNGITADQLRSLPEYDEDRFDTEHEKNIRNVFGGLGAAAVTGTVASTTKGGHDDDFYDHEHFNEKNLYRNRDRTGNMENAMTIPVVQEELQIGKKEVETGGVRLRSRIVEKEVSENVNLREEKVNIERAAVNRPASEGDLIEGDIEVVEHAEVPVVNKEARVVEEVKLNKEITERDETINDTVRNTEVTVEKTGDNSSDINDSVYGTDSENTSNTSNR